MGQEQSTAAAAPESSIGNKVVHPPLPPFPSHPSPLPFSRNTHTHTHALHSRLPRRATDAVASEQVLSYVTAPLAACCSTRAPPRASVLLTKKGELPVCNASYKGDLHELQAPSRPPHPPPPKASSTLRASFACSLSARKKRCTWSCRCLLC